MLDMVNIWKKNNPDKVREQKRRWRERHKEDINKTFNKWKNKTDYNNKMRNYAKEYRKNNKEKVKLQRFAYYKLKEDLIKEKGFKCENCKEKPKVLDLHHLEYKNKKDFLLLVCRSCHMKIHRGFN